MTMKRSNVFFFWGAMDLYFMLRFLWGSISQGRIPIYSDIVSFRQLDDPGWYAAPLLCLTLALILSIAVSAWLFLSGSRYAKGLAYVQTPLRLFLVTPSVSVIPWLLGLVDSRNVAINLTLLIGSEVLKLYTLYRYGRPRTPFDPSTGATANL